MMRLHAEFCLVFSPLFPVGVLWNEPRDDDDNNGVIFYESLPLGRATPLDVRTLRPFAFLSTFCRQKQTYELITVPDRSSVAAGLKYPLPEGWIPPRTNPQRATQRGLAARINHSFNLREITPCNRSPRFVISARSAVKRPRVVL